MAALEEKMSERLQQIEDMLSEIATKNTNQQSSKAPEYAPRMKGFSSTSEDSDDDSVRTQKRGHKLKRPLGQSRFLAEG